MKYGLNTHFKMAVLIGLFRVSVTVFMCLLSKKVQSQSLPERNVTETACYTQNINLVCSSDEVIAIGAVNAGAKLRSTYCYENTVVNTSNPDCCGTDADNDCITEYYNEERNLTYKYHDKCTGQASCGPIQVQWMQVKLDWCDNHTNYFDDSTYMFIKHYCINETRVGVLPEVTISSDASSALYLQGQEYPGYMPQTTYSSCNVRSTCSSGGFSIQALHIEFDTVGGTCQQEISINDTSGNTGYITCDDNNNYTITEVYTTSSSDVTVNVCSGQGNGRFWIGFIPTSGTCLKLSCHSVSNPSQTSCMSGFTTSVTESPTPAKETTVGGSVTTVAAAQTATSASTQENGPGSLPIILAVVGAILLLLIILVILLIRWKYKKQKNPKVAPEETENDIQDNDIFNEETFIPNTAPWATKVPLPLHRNLEPISRQDDHPKKQKKKKRKKNKKKKNKENSVEEKNEVND